MFLDLKVKSTDLRQQLSDLTASHPQDSYVYIYDVKSRLRDLKDDLITSPFKRACPIDANSFKKTIHSLWRDPGASCVSIVFSNSGV